MISHVMSDKKAQKIIKDLFIRCRKLNISLCFLTQSYFSVPKDVILSYTHYISFKLNNKRELQNIADIIILQILIMMILLKFIDNLLKILLIF